MERVPPRIDPALVLGDECEVQHVRGSGPGGQHRNKRQTGIRLTHRPSGVVVVATERRSQVQNHGAAMERLQARLIEQSRVQPERKPTRPGAGARRARLQAKRHRSDTKSLRRRPSED